MKTDQKIYFSLTTTFDRIDILRQALDSIVNQDMYDLVEKTYLNLDDNLTEEQLNEFRKFESVEKRIEIKICPAKWRSCNKLVWVYRDHGKDSVIVTWDGDKIYPKECFKQLLDEHIRNPNAIIAQECNPVVRVPYKTGFIFRYINGMDIKFMESGFASYLSNACLFPSGCFSDMLYDYDIMVKTTDSKHDEKFFWLVSTLCGTRVIGLDYTWSYYLDGTDIPNNSKKLTEINADPKNIESYNNRFNQYFGKEINDVFDNNPVIFRVTHSNAQGIIFGMPVINNLYGNFWVRFDLSEVAPSWGIAVRNLAKGLNWYRIDFV